MKRKAFAWLVALTLVIGAAAAGPCWASTIVPEGVDDAWHDHPVAVAFKAGGQAVATQYKLGSETAWREGDSLTVSAEGVTSLVYLSSNEVGVVLPVTDASFPAEVLGHPGLMLVEFWDPG